MARRYKEPPIIEAVAEFRFQTSSPSDVTIPGLMYEGVRQFYPKRRQARIVETAVTAGPASIQQQVTTLERLQLLSEDEKLLLQVAPDYLSVNHLKPYSGWHDFFPEIKRAFDIYCRIANPTGIQRVGLRYINQIEIPGRTVRLEDYINFRPFLGPGLPQDFVAFIVGIQVPYNDGRDLLRIQLSNGTPEKPETMALLLDLDMSLARPGEVSLASAVEWVNTSHQVVEEAFEACISERLRELFMEVKK